MNFSERLKELRTEKHLTQRELAQYLSLSPNCICEWEKGRSEPSLETLKKLALRLDCTVDYLIGFSDDFGNITIADHAFTKKENNLIHDFRGLAPDLQHRACSYIKKLKDLYDFESKD